MKTKNSIPVLDSLIQTLQQDSSYIDDSNELLSPTQVAEELGMHINTIYRILQTGKLRAYNVSVEGRRNYYRIKRVDLENYLEERYCVR